MDKIDYKRLLDFAKFQVIRRTLDLISDSDFTPHLEILFFTYLEGVIMPDLLKKLYPTQVLIILQHQFYDLKIFENEFTVTLSFSRKQEKVTVPFFAISKFHNKVSGDTLIFDKTSIDYDKEKKCTREPLSGDILSIDQLRN